MGVTLADIQAARGVIAGQVLRTPMLPAPRLSALTRAAVFVKYENLQVTNSFKDRGAFNKLASLSPSARARSEYSSTLPDGVGKTRPPWSLKWVVRAGCQSRETKMGTPCFAAASAHAFTTGMMRSPSATGSEPPGQKSFWGSTRRRASPTCLNIAVSK